MVLLAILIVVGIIATTTYIYKGLVIQQALKKGYVPGKEWYIPGS